MKRLCILGLALGVSILLGCGGAGAGGGGEAAAGDDSGGEEETPEVEEPLEESGVNADAGGPYATLFVEPPITVEFDGSGTTDPDSEIATYRWDPGDGSDAIESATPYVTHAYNPSGPGEYKVTLSVLNGQGVSLDEDQGSVRFRSVPEASFTVITVPDDIELGADTEFDASGSNDVDGLGEITQYRWSFDHATAYIPGRVSAEPAITYVFAALGEVVVSLVVVNDDGFESEPAQQTITVNDSEGARFIIQ